MDLRKTFNTDEYNYDRSRPDYPKELFEDIFDYVNLSKNCNVLEIGIGTGQATLPFLKQGCNVTAIELGDKPARYSKHKFSEFSNFSIINTDFIKAKLPVNFFDFIYSATAFHWIPKDSGYAKIKSLLKANQTALSLCFGIIHMSAMKVTKQILQVWRFIKSIVLMIKHPLNLIYQNVKSKLHSLNNTVLPMLNLKYISVLAG